MLLYTMEDFYVILFVWTMARPCHAPANPNSTRTPNEVGQTKKKLQSLFKRERNEEGNRENRENRESLRAQEPKINT